MEHQSRANRVTTAPKTGTKRQRHCDTWASGSWDIETRSGQHDSRDTWTQIAVTERPAQDAGTFGHRNIETPGCRMPEREEDTQVPEMTGTPTGTPAPTGGDGEVSMVP